MYIFPHTYFLHTYIYFTNDFRGEVSFANFLRYPTMRIIHPTTIHICKFPTFVKISRQTATSVQSPNKKETQPFHQEQTSDSQTPTRSFPASVLTYNMLAMESTLQELVRNQNILMDILLKQLYLQICPVKIY